MKVFVVIGLGQFGMHVALSLQEGGGEVLAIDQDEGRVESVKDRVSQAVCLNATSLESLRAVGVAKAQTAVVAVGENDLEAGVVACAALSDLGVANIIVRAANDLQARILERVGATKVVFPERQAGEHIARSILMSGVIEQVTLSTGQTVAQIRLRRDLVGRTLKDVQFRQRFSINVIGIQRKTQYVDDNGANQWDEKLDGNPDPDEIIGAEDIVIVVGNQAQIELIARND
ncbi:MAG: TrkA family potassium uptake protein [Deltaproteobacteria bacterium]|nr:TrkA family potassium uptake protein [Deltaproteobacteria bacterium]